MSWQSWSSCRVENQLSQHVRAAAKFSGGWPHFWVQIWIPKWGPELYHIFSPSFKSLLGLRFGIQIWTQKWVSHRRILLLPAEDWQADMRRISMGASVSTCFFCVVLNTFLGPVLGAIMRQVCCHSPCHCFLMLALRRPSLKAPLQPSNYEALYSWWTWPTKPSGLQTPKLCSHHSAVDVVGLFVCTIILEI